MDLRFGNAGSGFAYFTVMKEQKRLTDLKHHYMYISLRDWNMLYQLQGYVTTENYTISKAFPNSLFNSLRFKNHLFSSQFPSSRLPRPL